MWQPRSLAVVIALGSLASCSGAGLPPSDSVVVAVAPTQATVKVGGTVGLLGSGTGFTSAPMVQWGMRVSDGTIGACGKLDTQARDFTGCPDGFVMFHDVTTVPSNAVYYAPQTPGTYHVVLWMTQVVRYDYLQKQAVATITVTP